MHFKAKVSVQGMFCSPGLIKWRWPVQIDKKDPSTPILELQYSLLSDYFRVVMDNINAGMAAFYSKNGGSRPDP